jgi:hypothetical protein
VRSWMNAGQEGGGAAQPALAGGAAETGATEVGAQGPAATIDAAPEAPTRPEVAVTAVAAPPPAKPEKKVGRFKAWLNADQPPADDQTSGGSKGATKS